jgi:linoleoyl-CoA desaturase
LIFLVLPLFSFSLSAVLIFYVVRNMAIGVALFVVAAPAHLPHEAVLVDGDMSDLDHVQLQTSVTLNFRTGPIGRFFICGSEHQIEHHLFPGLSHLRYREVSELVETFCRERGYPYRTLPWGRAVWKSLRVFWRPKPVLTRLEPLEVATSSDMA